MADKSAPWARWLCRYNTIPFDYWEIPWWAPLCALVGIVFGLVFCILAFTLLSLLLGPKICGQNLYNMWSEPLDPDRAPRNTGGSEDGDVCIQLCKCIWYSAQDLCLFCVVIFRVLASCGIFVGSILFIPLAILYSVWIGLSSGAMGWFDPKNIYEEPWKQTLQFIKDVEDNFINVRRQHAAPTCSHPRPRVLPSRCASHVMRGAAGCARPQC